MDAENIRLNIEDSVKALLEERGIREEDVAEAIASAESGGIKFYEEGSSRCLAKKVIGNFTAYAEYEVCSDGTYTVNSAYGHKIKIISDM